MKRFLISIVACTALSSCAAIPAYGPMATTVVAGAGSDKSGGYELVDLDERVVSVLRDSRPSLVGSFGDKRPAPRQAIGIGDTLTIAVFESAPGGLFSPPAQSITTGSRQQVIPNQVVDQNGNIDVPYGGRIHAAGKTSSEVARLIEKSLVARAIEPQVVVTPVENSANTATVLGETIGNAGRIKLSVGGDRILTVLAAAGGTRGTETDTQVRLVRNGRVETVPLRTIVNAPSENIYVYPGDTLFLIKEAQAFNVFGAVVKPGQYVIDSGNLSLSDALGRANGLADNRADAGGVFLFRYEKPAAIRGILGRETTAMITDSGVPTVYRIRFNDPRSFLWLQQIPVRSSDVIYAANSLTVEFDKFMSTVDRVSAIGLKVSQTRRYFQ